MPTQPQWADMSTDDKIDFIDGAIKQGLTSTETATACDADLQILRAFANSNDLHFLKHAGRVPRMSISPQQELGRARECGWVVGKDQFCGDPTKPGKSYCPAHDSDKLILKLK